MTVKYPFYSSLCLSLILYLGGFALIPVSHADNLDSIPSKHWPNEIALKKPLSIANSKGRLKKLSSGSIGLLQRVENGLLLVDFGRHGVFFVNPENTDFLQKVDSLKQGVEHKSIRNFSHQILSRLVIINASKNTFIPYEDHARKKGYLVYYPGICTEESRSITSQIGSLFSAHENVQLMMLAPDMQWYKYFNRFKFTIPVFLPNLAGPYADSFYHKNSPGPSLVAVDPNGKVLYRSPTLARTPIKKNKRLMTRKEQLKESYKTVIDELNTATARIENL